MERIELVDAETMAELLGVTPAYLRKRARQRAIPAVDVRGGKRMTGTSRRARWRFSPHKVVSALENGALF